jgi:hypothetical protein
MIKSFTRLNSFRGGVLTPSSQYQWVSVRVACSFMPKEVVSRLVHFDNQFNHG